MVKEITNDAKYLIKIAFVKYDHTGKFRPVLVLESDPLITIWRITSKYLNKSRQIQKQYFPLFNWKILGLDRFSYVDLGSEAKLKPKDYFKTSLSKAKIIGIFSQSNLILFEEFHRIYSNSKHS